MLIFLFISLVYGDEFYSYGLNNEFDFPNGANVLFGPIELTQSFVYFDEVYTNLYIHSDGYITLTNQSLTNDKSIAIVPYWLENNSSIGGIISFREILHSFKLDYFSLKIQKTHGNFQANYGFIVTWFELRSRDWLDKRKNSFQLVLLSNGKYTYVIFNLYSINRKSNKEFTSIIKSDGSTKYAGIMTSGIWNYRVDSDFRARLYRKIYKKNNSSSFFINFYLIISSILICKINNLN